ncbi:MAG: tRNA uridine-5-carboxymethylaminomethyl(34) synthesis GTPase MnmE [Burkholderiaceae bacterium]|jgi:tRNA modification GTPase
MRASDLDSIVAIATAAGRGGIGIVRVSGNAVGSVMRAVCGVTLNPRHATHLGFRDGESDVIDDGIAIFFPTPHSYTGEDVLELQGHGGPVVLQMLLRRCLQAGRDQGLRLAEPGEFTRRAYLNDKLDLAQAEAVADLIEASTEAAARSARASMEGAFSLAVRDLVEELIRIRLIVEATLDFPEEEIEFLKTSDVARRLASLCDALENVLEKTSQGALLRQGVKVVLVGRPNVGKSSLLNALAEAEIAIVTPIPGTTRDRVVQAIQIEGLAVHIIDTAGLRDTDDPIEQIGIRRTWEEIAQADVILVLRDGPLTDMPDDAEIFARLPASVPRRFVINKIDLSGEIERVDGEAIFLSALSGAGVDLLRREIQTIAGWHASAETVFLGRQRHLEALQGALNHLLEAREYVLMSDRALELLAEELRLAQDELAQITGAYSSDDLLGDIFSRFCIGK